MSTTMPTTMPTTSRCLPLPTETILQTHKYAAEEHRVRLLSTSRMKHIFKDIEILSRELPENIYVRYAEDRPDFMKILIAGVQETPYAGGLFEFDLWCPGEYPALPPKVTFCTTGGGRYSFNPNLYNTGYVCLSIIGTWQASSWIPNHGTILGVLVALQACVLIAEPYKNEPGRELLTGNSESRRYNRRLHPNVVRYAMLDWLEKKSYGLGNNRRTDGVWDEVVKTHFTMNKEAILNTIKGWVGDRAPKEEQPYLPEPDLFPPPPSLMASQEQLLHSPGDGVPPPNQFHLAARLLDQERAIVAQLRAQLNAQVAAKRAASYSAMAAHYFSLTQRSAPLPPGASMLSAMHGNPSQQSSAMNLAGYSTPHSGALNYSNHVFPAQALAAPLAGTPLHSGSWVQQSSMMGHGGFSGTHSGTFNAINHISPDQPSATPLAEPSMHSGNIYGSWSQQASETPNSGDTQTHPGVNHNPAAAPLIYPGLYGSENQFLPPRTYSQYHQQLAQSGHSQPTYTSPPSQSALLDPYQSSFPNNTPTAPNATTALSTGNTAPSFSLVPTYGPSNHHLQGVTRNLSAQAAYGGGGLYGRLFSSHQAPSNAPASHSPLKRRRKIEPAPLSSPLLSSPSPLSGTRFDNPWGSDDDYKEDILGRKKTETPAERRKGRKGSTVDEEGGTPSKDLDDDDLQGFVGELKKAMVALGKRDRIGRMDLRELEKFYVQGSLG